MRATAQALRATGGIEIGEFRRSLLGGALDFVGRTCENEAMPADSRRPEIVRLRAALAASEARAAALEAELATVRGQLDELLRIAATQNEHLSDMRTMLRRRMTQRKKGNTSDSEDDIAG